jgi:hypothetical protein
MNDLLLLLRSVIAVVVGKCGGVIWWIANRARGFRVNVLRGCTHVEVNGGMHRGVLEFLARWV